jgi:hypothetical protein
MPVPLFLITYILPAVPNAAGKVTVNPTPDEASIK